MPYIGDLLGVRGLRQVAGPKAFSPRATSPTPSPTAGARARQAVLEQLARDATGWQARAVEFFELLATTQHVNHVRPANRRTPDLRRTDALELLERPSTRPPTRPTCGGSP